MDDNPAIAFLLTHLSARAAELSLPCSMDEAAQVLQHRTLLVGHYAVLMSGLGNDLSQADVWVRAAEYQAANALSGLPDKYREDLHLFLIGPPGACEDLRWVELASQIERDERVCRKLVWLPPQSSMENSVQTFLDRTFLARPWRALEGIHPPHLDPVADIVRMLSSHDELRDIPPSALNQWFEVLTQPGDSPDLVEPLVRALKELKQ
jgi:hypothetical protein